VPVTCTSRGGRVREACAPAYRHPRTLAAWRVRRFSVGTAGGPGGGGLGEGGGLGGGSKNVWGPGGLRVPIAAPAAAPMTAPLGPGGTVFTPSAGGLLPGQGVSNVPLSESLKLPTTTAAAAPAPAFTGTVAPPVAPPRELTEREKAAMALFGGIGGTPAPAPAATGTPTRGGFGGGIGAAAPSSAPRPTAPVAVSAPAPAAPVARPAAPAPAPPPALAPAPAPAADLLDLFGGGAPAPAPRAPAPAPAFGGLGDMFAAPAPAPASTSVPFDMFGGPAAPASGGFGSPASPPLDLSGAAVPAALAGIVAAVGAKRDPAAGNTTLANDGTIVVAGHRVLAADALHLVYFIGNSSSAGPAAAVTFTLGAVDRLAVVVRASQAVSPPAAAGGGSQAVQLGSIAPRSFAAVIVTAQLSALPLPTTTVSASVKYTAATGAFTAPVSFTSDVAATDLLRPAPIDTATFGGIWTQPAMRGEQVITLPPVVRSPADFMTAIHTTCNFHPVQAIAESESAGGRGHAAVSRSPANRESRPHHAPPPCVQPRKPSSPAA